MNYNLKKVKIFVMVPKENLDDVRTAMCNAGAGVIGNYTFCSTSTKSVGTFIPSDNAKPYIGEQNKLEFVEEEKLEVICDVENVKNAMALKPEGYILKTTKPEEILKRIGDFFAKLQ